MDTVNATITLNVQGWPELRREVAGIIREVAAREADPRVAARLYEVAAVVAQETAEREARQVVNRVTPHSPRAERELLRTEIRALETQIAALEGGKA